MGFVVLGKSIWMAPSVARCLCLRSWIYSYHIKKKKKLEDFRLPDSLYTLQGEDFCKCSITHGVKGLHCPTDKVTVLTWYSLHTKTLHLGTVSDVPRPPTKDYKLPSVIRDLTNLWNPWGRKRRSSVKDFLLRRPTWLWQMFLLFYRGWGPGCRQHT